MLRKIALVVMVLLSFNVHAKCTKEDVAVVAAIGVGAAVVGTTAIAVGMAATTSVMVAGTPTALVYMISGAAPAAFLSGYIPSTIAAAAVLPTAMAALISYGYISEGCKTIEDLRKATKR
jgi:hypothetical protein